jgi:two-component system CheB/CheR fusion protein
MTGMATDQTVINKSEGEARMEGPPDREAMPVNDEAPPRLPFPIVGIGASAGGLEAMTEFLSGVRADSGMAYIFIQHLPPTGESMLPGILSKRTELTVLAIDDAMVVEPNKLYVIRPGHTLTIENGVLRLGERLARPMGNRPVDDFFKSLSQEQRERAIAVILSGMGSNGTAGCQAIKAVGGLCVAQDPESANFPSMPRHLIDAGYADYILRPQDMGDVLLAYAGHPYARGEREEEAEPPQRDVQHVREILAILRTRTRQDFNGYKKPTILRRIQRRMGLHRLNLLADYARMLRQSATEVTALADDLLIHVTGFFRDADAWEGLRQQVIIPLVSGRNSGESIRCWVAACSSGEEAYTLGMLLVEEAERANKSLDIKVFATDMADRTLQNARAGVFPGGIESEIEPQRLERFFMKEEAVYRVRQDLREKVIFAPQNVLQDPPFSRLDIVTCRNLLIYLEPEMQRRILELLHFGLREGGALFLGTSETTGGDGLFEPIDKKSRIYRRIGPTRHGAIDFPLPHGMSGRIGSKGPTSPGEAAQTGPRPTVTQMTSRALLEHHMPAAVTIDRDRRIVYYHGNTELYIAPPRGEPTRDLMELVRENVRGAVRTALHQAHTQNRVITVLDGWRNDGPGRRIRVGVTVSPLDSKFAPDSYVVSFLELGEQPSSNATTTSAADDAADDLRRAREELQSTIEELQTSNEELKASHEEVVSTNEEFQSTNEELETSREEMQSLNEELSTVNAQLQAKMEEHQAAHNDLSSLLTSTDLAVLFLDTTYRIRRYTPQVLELMDLISTDIGRPLNDLAKKFTDPDLTADVNLVLTRLLPIEREVQNLARGWFLRRITPYRTSDNRIDGVVITFVDITARRQAEMALRASEEQFRRAIQEAPIPVIMQAEDGQVMQISRTWTELTGYSLTDVPTGDAWLQHAYGPGAVEIRRHMHDLFQDSVRTLNVDFAIRSRLGDMRHWSFSASSPGSLSDGRRFIVGMAIDITDRHRAQAALLESEERFRLLVDNARDFAMLMFDASGRITTWNEGAQRMLGWSSDEAIGQSCGIIFTNEDREKGLDEQELSRAALAGRAEDERWHVRKDGSRFWGSGVTTPLRNPDATVRGFVKVMRDDTERQSSAESLRNAKHAAEESNRIKDHFLATLSHELRTPLSAILLWGNLLRGDEMASNPESLREGLDAIMRSAQAQKELIEDLLDVSRITSGNLRLQLRDVELLEVVRDAIATVAPAANAKKVVITPDFGVDVGVVRCDPDRVRQIVWNLLSNAVKFTPEGGRVDVGVWRDGLEIEIRVTDTGKGIDSSFLPHIYDPFRQADEGTTRQHGGLGLGMAIVKQLIDLQHGTINVESAGIDKGSAFTIRLPLPKITVKRRAATPNRASIPHSQVGHGSENLKRKRVLVVEDDTTTRNALVTLLRNAGLIVHEAENAATGIASYAQTPPDLIISDIGLPGEDGHAMMRQIRQQEAADARPPVPALALTAFVRDSDQRAAIQAGFQAHLAKPAEPDELLTTLVGLIEGAVSPAK